MAKETGFVYYSGSRAIFYSGKNLFELVKRKEGFNKKPQALESPDSDKRAKSYTRMKIGSGIAIRKITDLIREKEKRRTPIFFLFFGTENEVRRTSAVGFRRRRGGGG